MKTLEDLFKYQIKNLFSAETQLLIALQEMAITINDKKLTKIIENHFDDSKKQKSRLEVICREINISPSGNKCLAMKGIIKEAEKFRKQASCK
jgi:ferritin-like metal-binding protein YciE